MRPKLTHEAISLITEYFVSLRKLSAQNPEVPLPLTPRQGEGLIRLAEAYAKMALKDTVDA
ncbi:MCM2/3/5 family protein [compost metagenome]